MASFHDNRLVSLPYLPDEVLIEIFSRLPRDGRLISTTLACRRFQILTQEFLYHTIDMKIGCTNDEIEALDLSRWPHDLKRVSGLVDHFAANPELG